MEENVDKDGRRVYSKPLLKVVELAADEVLATGCKTHAASSVGNPTCQFKACVSMGSS